MRSAYEFISIVTKCRPFVLFFCLFVLDLKNILVAFIYAIEHYCLQIFELFFGYIAFCFQIGLQQQQIQEEHQDVFILQIHSRASQVTSKFDDYGFHLMKTEN